VTLGSGRPVSAHVLGDANRDGNDSNDRLPGYRRNSFTGPNYATTNLRVTRRFYLSQRLQLETIGEAFNVFNRANRRVDITDDGFLSSAADFVPQTTSLPSGQYPGYYRLRPSFLEPNNAYAPREVQFALRLRF